MISKMYIELYYKLMYYINYEVYCFYFYIIHLFFSKKFNDWLFFLLLRCEYIILFNLKSKINLETYIIEMNYMGK